MKTNEFSFSGSFLGKKYTANATAFKVSKCPQVYVSINLGKPQNTIITFYYVNEKGKPFFWHKLHGEKENLAKTIERKLRQNLDAVEGL